MIFANVAVKRKTQGTGIFTYAVTADQLTQIKIGVLVSVPLRQDKVEGIVIGLRKTFSAAQAKTIKKILSREPVVTLNQLRLANWLANFYGVSHGEALFTITPSLSKNLLKK